MAYLDDLKSRRTSLMTALDTAIAAGPNHTITSDNGGRTVNSGDYQRQLIESLKEVNALIVAANPAVLVNRAYYSG